ncbi:class I SAM-dependent methyltransferase [Rhodocytophaga rosea]|uniref:Class I SAM-dependent methyltransferase n=1 Tax=Rhodocytophaga rosea TaxID=2704465 RepID=A0A6C0GH96_9BACT|nr:class I SAM-dependent methyltransferase [Rhodocytophaga rosea]QHT67265.1 class I SAM-dependent methyltransferase [Rhodocytophaga rosea]
MDEEQIKAVARQLRQPYGEAGIQVGEKMNESNAHINLFTIEQLQHQAHDRILEIGMGNGFFVKDILSNYPSVRYVGCDFSEVMIGQAQKLNEVFVKNGQAQFISAGACNLPFEKESFDKIFTVNTLYFWENPATVLAQIKQVLKPGGLLVMGIRPKHIMESLPFTKYGFTMYNKEDVTELLANNGFTITNIFEKEEPLQTIAGYSYKMESLIVSAVKTEQ